MRFRGCRVCVFAFLAAAWFPALPEVTGDRFFAKGVAYNPRNELLGLSSLGWGSG